jgi:hypothetical protein
MSKSPSRLAGRSTTSEQTKLASSPVSAAKSRACSTACSEKSAPVTLAPRLAQESVSSPK